MKVLRTMTDITTKMSLMWELLLEGDRSPAILMGCVGMGFPKEKMETSNRTTYSTIDTVQQAYLSWIRHTCLLAGPWVGKIAPRDHGWERLKLDAGPLQDLKSECVSLLLWASRTAPASGRG